MLLRYCWLFLLAHVCAAGQEGLGIVFPERDQVDVSPSTSIYVRSAAVLDTVQWKIHGPPILILRDSIAHVQPRSHWQRFRIAGTLEAINETTFRWTPKRLLPATTYRCVTEHEERTFTTAPDVPVVKYCDLDQQPIQCNTSIKLLFTSPLPQQCILDSIVFVEQLLSNGVWTRSQVTMQVDGANILVQPRSRWTANTPLRLRVRCSWYAGDRTADKTYEAVVRGATNLVVNARTTEQKFADADLTSEVNSNSRVLQPGDTAYVSVPKFIAPNHVFLYWESADNASQHRDTSTTIAVVLMCDQMQRTNVLTAVYRRIDSVQIRVNADTVCGVEIYNSDGRLLHTVTRPTTISIQSSDGPVVCVAKPSLRAVFDGWMFRGSIVSATAIVIPTMQALSADVLSLNPKYQVLEPSADTYYSLQGSIVDIDADALFDVSTAVHFSTPHRYESTNPTTRTLCVVAQRCWEIVGYHDQAAGGPVWFDTGLQEYCITAELLDPENHVVFFVRRKMLDLRIEKVLLGSEDPSDVITDRLPHPETRIDVQRQQYVMGILEWITLSSSECRESAMQYSRYRLRCGDNIRLIVHPAQQRGQQWRWWSSLPNYVVPKGKAGAQPSTFTLVVDLDLARFDAVDCQQRPLDHREIRMQAAFRQQMIIESIGLRVRVNAQGAREHARFEERWYDPLTYYDTDADEPPGGRQMEYVPRRGTPVRARFSLPLEPLTALGSSVRAESYDNILLTNPHQADLDFAVAADTTGNTNLLSSTGQFLDIVEFWICDPTTKPRLQALHTGSIDVTYTTGVQAYNGQSLRASQTFALRRMELPGYGIKLMRMEVEDDGDWDFWPFVNRGELYHAVYGGDLATHQALQTERGFARLPNCDEQQGKPGECTQTHGDEDGPLDFAEHPLWLQTSWMDSDDLAWVAISTWDEDCKDENDCLVNRMEEVVDSLRIRVAKYNVPIEAAALDWKALIPDLVKTGVDLIDAFVAPDDQDDFLAEATVLEDSQTRWGMRNAEAPFMTRYHENGMYTLKGQWYTARAVVR
ncbi:MAG: hypothetical protein RLZZ273_287 [Bacteroidota bacterium]